MPELIVDGEVIEADPPRKLVQTWRRSGTRLVAEGFTRLTYEIEEDDGGITRLTVTHELEGAPSTRRRSRAPARIPRAAAAGAGS